MGFDSASPAPAAPSGQQSIVEQPPPQPDPLTGMTEQQAFRDPFANGIDQIKAQQAQFADAKMIRFGRDGIAMPQPTQYNMYDREPVTMDRRNLTAKELTRQMWESSGREAINGEIQKDMRKAKVLDWLKENVHATAQMSEKSSGGGSSGGYRSGGGNSSTLSLGGGGQGNPYLEALISMLAQSSMVGGTPRHSTRNRTR